MTVTQEDAALELYGSVKVKIDGFHLIGRNGLWRHATDYELSRILNKFNEMKIDKTRQNKLNEIEYIFIEKASKNIQYMDNTFQMNEKTQKILSTTLSAGSVPDGFAWYNIHNNPVPMTYEQLQGLSAMAVSRGAILFYQKQQYKALVREAETIEDIEEIVWE